MPTLGGAFLIRFWCGLLLRPCTSRTWNADRFVLDESSVSVGVHCWRHGCRLNKVMHKRPCGYFLAWLIAGESLEPGDDNRQAHLDMKFELGPSGGASLAKRRAARRKGLSDASLRQLFEWEGEGLARHGVLDHTPSREPRRIT